MSFLKLSIESHLTANSGLKINTSSLELKGNGVQAFNQWPIFVAAQNANTSRIQYPYQ